MHSRKFTVDELVDIFGFDLVWQQTTEKLKEYEDRLSELKKGRKRALERAQLDNPERFEEAEELGDAYFEVLLGEEWDFLTRQINRLKRDLTYLEGDRETGRVNLEEVKRDVSIKSLAESYGVKFRKAGSNRFKAPCPLHREKDPSFFIFTDTNSFYCFGCQEGGTVIDFVMKIDDVDFKQALAVLT